jgi:hypothetical protein
MAYFYGILAVIGWTWAVALAIFFGLRWWRIRRRA